MMTRFYVPQSRLAGTLATPGGTGTPLAWTLPAAPCHSSPMPLHRARCDKEEKETDE